MKPGGRANFPKLAPSKAQGRDTGRGQRPQAVSGEVQIGHQEKFPSCMSGQALAQAAQGSGGVPIPGGVQNRVDVALGDMV